MENLKELESFLAEATQEDVWGRLLYRGTAWAIMRQAGKLPEDAPALGATIETDLAEYGFATLRAALALKEQEGNLALCQQAFEKSANAFESLVRNGSPNAVERGFYRVIAGAAYHLAGFSAIAYSLFNERDLDANYAPCEIALILLILRDFDRLRAYSRDWLLNPANADQALAASLQESELNLEGLIVVQHSTFGKALCFFWTDRFRYLKDDPGSVGRPFECLNVVPVVGKLNRFTALPVPPPNLPSLAPLQPVGDVAAIGGPAWRLRQILPHLTPSWRPSASQVDWLAPRFRAHDEKTSPVTIRFVHCLADHERHAFSIG